MALVIDTRVLLDLRLGDAVHGPPAVACLTAHASQGVLVWVIERHRDRLVRSKAGNCGENECCEKGSVHSGGSDEVLHAESRSLRRRFDREEYPPQPRCFNDDAAREFCANCIASRM